jgi:hypothetical protein
VGECVVWIVKYCCFFVGGVGGRGCGTYGDGLRPTDEYAGLRAYALSTVRNDGREAKAPDL